MWRCSLLRLRGLVQYSTCIGIKRSSANSYNRRHLAISASASATKLKTEYRCSECGSISPKWLGQCQSCQAWGTVSAVTTSNHPAAAAFSSAQSPAGSLKMEVLNMKSVTSLSGPQSRISTGISEFDRVLGGGLVSGSFVLVGGAPGVGKSTLMLQACRNFAKDGLDVMYVSAEESTQQVMLRAARLGEFPASFHVACESNYEIIEDYVRNNKCDVLIIDSVQTIYTMSHLSSPGSTHQVREVSSRLLTLAKRTNTAIFAVGHVTKDGNIAGPRALEHLVDVVLYFDDTSSEHRLLRNVKNRFGSTNEVGVFKMTIDGLECVPEPSAFFLQERTEGEAGSVLAATLAGSRCVLVEMQALVSPTSFQGMSAPKHRAIGLNQSRIAQLAAVMDSRMQLSLTTREIFVNVVGGIRIEEPAVDLSVAAAMISSLYHQPPPPFAAFCGEIGLTGELRGVPQLESRISEAARIGLKQIFLPKATETAAVRAAKGKISLVFLNRVDDLLGQVFEKRNVTHSTDVGDVKRKNKWFKHKRSFIAQ